MATDQYIVYLDRRVELTGVFSSGVTTWTLPFTDSTINCIVPGFTSGAAVNGVAVTPDTSTGTTVTKAGNYSGGVCTLGRTYQSQVLLSKPLVRDNNNFSLIGPRFLVRGLSVFHRRAGSYTVRLDRPSPNSDVSRSFQSPVGPVENNGVFIARLPGNPDREQWYIEDSTPKPMVVTGLDWFGDYGEVCR
jgi:hypothetical protein